MSFKDFNNLIDKKLKVTFLFYSNWLLIYASLLLMDIRKEIDANLNVIIVAVYYFFKYFFVFNQKFIYFNSIDLIEALFIALLVNCCCYKCCRFSCYLLHRRRAWFNHLPNMIQIWFGLIIVQVICAVMLCAFLYLDICARTQFF